MKRLLIAVGLGLVVLSPAAHADDAPAPACGLTSAPLLASSDGNVLIGCSGGVSEAFGNQLAEVLNRILQNRLDPQMVMAKLDEIDRVPDDGMPRVVDDGQRQAIVQSLVGKPAEQITITAHLAVDDSAEFAKGIAAPLIMVGWQIEGHQIRRAASRALDGVHGVAIVVRNRDAAPPKAMQLRSALSAAHIGSQLVSDPNLPADAVTLWIGRRPVFMQAEAGKP
jgi:hypothetical protein